jgi:predicted ATP-grasp superfamily ATP-dependent carboligase
MPAATLTMTRNAIAQDPAVAANAAAGKSAGAALPPVILLGGEANALSVCRSLGKLGAPVVMLGDPKSYVKHSRHCRWIGLPDNKEETWSGWLLGPESDQYAGAVLLSASDAGIRVIAKHRAALSARFKLDLSDPAAQLSMLDKLTTYRNALAAGVATPKFWTVESRQQVMDLKEQLVYPLIVKPHLSHVFEARFNKKFLFASNLEDVLAGVDAASAAGLEVLLMEWIPGPDTLLSSYFTYLDEKGQPQFHFTKRVIRRYPTGMGGASYHITDWIPELIEPSLKLFRHVGLRGLANVEYKLDERDGIHKIIECNARFVGSNQLVANAGFDLARFVYNRLTGRPQPALTQFKTGQRMWDPGRDLAAFKELRARGEITLWQWLKSVSHPQTFQWFSPTDPMPAVARTVRPIWKKMFGAS